MKQECAASNEHEAARSYTEDQNLSDFKEQTHSMIFNAVPNTTYNHFTTLFTYKTDFFAQQQ